jgi:hypothetical protein
MDLRKIWLKTNILVLSAIPTFAGDVDTSQAQSEAWKFVKFIIAVLVFLIMFAIANFAIIGGAILSIVIFKSLKADKERGKDVGMATLIGIPLLVLFAGAVAQVGYLKIITFALPKFADLLTNAYDQLFKLAFGGGGG